jgi:hypothetical protein
VICCDKISGYVVKI